ncbi:MAG: FAD-dependent oxidoreductase [Elusimicrobiota bacterium]
MKKNVTIIGGGLSGLAAGLELSENGCAVTVFEKDEQAGGLARSFLKNNVWLPVAYHHVMRPDKTTLKYINKLGLTSELFWKRSPQAVWYENKQYIMSAPLDILKLDFFGLIDKLKFARFGAYCFLKNGWKGLDDISCQEWLEKKAGRKATEILFKNLVEMKFGMPLQNLSVPWLANRLHQSVRSRDWYAYLKNGIKHFIDIMVERIKNNGGVILTRAEVTGIRGNKVAVSVEKGNKIVNEELYFDYLINTTPPPVFLKIAEIPSDAKELLERIKYKNVLSFVCGSKENRTPYYWNIVLSPHLFFGGIFNHSALYPGNVEKTGRVYYLFRYIDDGDELFSRNREFLEKKFSADLTKFWQGFKYDWFEIFRLKNSQPVFERGYKNPPEKLTDKIILAGVYKEFPSPRTMSSALESGLKAAKIILEQ